MPDGCEPINATIPGSVWKVLIEEGQEVKKGDTVAVLESMKMEFPIESEYSGVIEKVFIKTSQQVVHRERLRYNYSQGQMIAAVKTEE